jgi:hypothetical protein
MNDEEEIQIQIENAVVIIIVVGVVDSVLGIRSSMSNEFII